MCLVVLHLGILAVYKQRVTNKAYILRVVSKPFYLIFMFFLKEKAYFKKVLFKKE